jgi:hypothetical protein
MYDTPSWFDDGFISHHGPFEAKCARGRVNSITAGSAIDELSLGGIDNIVYNHLNFLDREKAYGA